MSVWKILAAVTALSVLTSCGPLVGAAAVVGADKVAEEDGDQGLF